MVVVRAVDEERRADGERDRLARLFDELDNLDVVHVRDGDAVDGEYAIADTQALALLCRTVLDNFAF